MIMSPHCWKYFVFPIKTAIKNLPLSLFFLSIAAALQVSISLNKVELSVGESKFFICTGTCPAHTHTHTHTWHVWRWVTVVKPTLVAPFCFPCDAEWNRFSASIWRVARCPLWAAVAPPPQCPPWRVYKHSWAEPESAGWQDSLAGPVHPLLLVSSLLPAHSVWSKQRGEYRLPSLWEERWGPVEVWGWKNSGEWIQTWQEMKGSRLALQKWANWQMWKEWKRISGKRALGVKIRSFHPVSVREGGKWRRDKIWWQSHLFTSFCVMLLWLETRLSSGNIFLWFSQARKGKVQSPDMFNEFSSYLSVAGPREKDRRWEKRLESQTMFSFHSGEVNTSTIKSVISYCVCQACEDKSSGTILNRQELVVLLLFFCRHIHIHDICMLFIPLKHKVLMWGKSDFSLRDKSRDKLL